jgi:hypothetical protein
MDREMSAEARRCPCCGETLSVDEALIAVVRGQNAGRTSLAAIGRLAEDGVLLVHEGCYDPAATVPSSADRRLRPRAVD